MNKIMSKAMRQMRFGRTINNQKRFDAIEETLVESKQKLMEAHEKYAAALAAEDYERADFYLNRVRGWLSDVNELSYDLDNCKDQINKDREELGLAEIK